MVLHSIKTSCGRVPNSPNILKSANAYSVGRKITHLIILIYLGML